MQDSAAIAGTTQLATFFLKRYHDLREDRKPQEARWEKSRMNFLGLFDKADTWVKAEGDGWRSKDHIGVTRRKVLTGVATIADFSLRNGQIPFSIEPDYWAAIDWDNLPPEKTKELDKITQQWEKLMRQQLDETHADRSLLRNIMSMATYGCTYSKRVRTFVTRQGYTPVNVSGVDLATVPNPEDHLAYVPYSIEDISQAWDYVPVWNMFRDWETDDRTQWSVVIHRDFISPYDLAGKRPLPGYDDSIWIDDAIRDVLAECKGTEDGKIDDEDTSGMAPQLRDLKHRTRNLRILECWGRAPVADVQQFKEHILSRRADPDTEAGQQIGISMPAVTETETKPGEEMWVLAIIVKDTVVGYAEVPYGEHPFEFGVWDDALDEAGGEGLADAVKPTQRMINGLVRRIMDNAALSASVILALKRRLIEKMGNSIEPGMLIDLNDEAKSATDAISQVKIESVIADLFAMLKWADEYSNEDSLLPRSSEGQPGEREETAYAMAERQANASKYVGLVLQNLDNQIIEPMIQAYYQANMDNPDLPIPRAALKMRARGYKAFQNRLAMITKIRDWLAIIMQSPELSARYKLSGIGKILADRMDLDLTQIERTDSEMEEALSGQAAEASARLQIETEKLQAEIDMAQAKTVEALSKARQVQAETQDARVKMIHELEERIRERETPTNGGTTT